MVDKNKKILITGGLGNLGSWLTHHFCNLNYDVTVLTQRQRKLEFMLPFKTIICDIRSLENCKSTITEYYDVIIHTASMNDNFIEGYAENALMVNALGTRNILETIKSNPPKHFIYFSTFHVYGKYSGNISEETELNSNNDYGTTHLFAEYYVKQFYQNFKIPYTIIRLSNSYGCPKDFDSSKWYLILNDLSKSAFKENRIKLNGNGLATRDFIWMGDVCDIIHRLTSIESTNDTYNISGEKAYSLLDVAEAVKCAYEEFFEKEIEIETNNEDKSLPKAPIVISSKKIKQLINYNAESHFKEEALKIFNFLKKENNDK